MRITRRSTMLAAIGPSYTGPMRRDDPGDGGGTGDGSPAGGGGTGGSGDDGGKPASDDGDGKKPKIDGDLDPERAAKTIAAAREGERKAKDAAKAAQDKQQATLDAVAVALGLKPDPKADPTELVKQAAAERDQAKAAARTQAVELAVYKRAGKAGADPDALLDSRGFLSAVAELDPAADDFGDKVTKAIETAVKDNPKLAAATAGNGTPGSQGPARQGTDHTGTSGDNKQRPRSLSEALRRGRS